MGYLAFLGGLLAVAAAITILVIYLRRRIRRFSSEYFGNPDILDALKEIDDVSNSTPRSLNACDTLLLPRVLADFPDFDPVTAKTHIRRQLQERFGSHEQFTIHNVAMARYLPSGLQKTIVYQAAAAWRENGAWLQKRYDLNYTYLLPNSSESIAANCPNCGGALGYGQRECPYCGSRVANPLGHSWQITEIRES